MRLESWLAFKFMRHFWFLLLSYFLQVSFLVRVCPVEWIRAMGLPFSSSNLTPRGYEIITGGSTTSNKKYPPAETHYFEDGDTDGWKQFALYVQLPN